MLVPILLTKSAVSPDTLGYAVLVKGYVPMCFTLPLTMQCWCSPLPGVKTAQICIWFKNSECKNSFYKFSLPKGLNMFALCSQLYLQ